MAPEKAVEKEAKPGRARHAGTRLADAIVEMVHLMYQKDTATRFLNALLARLQERKKEFIR